MSYHDDLVSLGFDYEWRLDDDLTDSIDSANSDGGSVAGYTTSIIPALAATENCADFNGSSNEVDIPNETDINSATTTQKVIALWANFDTINSTRRILWGEGGSQNGLSIHYVDVGGTPRLWFNVYEGTTRDNVSADDVIDTSGDPFFIVGILDCTGGAMYLYVNGTLAASKTGGLNISTSFSAHSAGVAIGGADSSLKDEVNGTMTGVHDGRIAGVGYLGEGTISGTDVGDLYASGLGAQDYPIDAAPGSYAVTGAAATLLRGRWINASPGSYGLTGAPATLARGYVLNAEPGSYVVTGQPATTLRGLAINAGSGSYVVTGQPATHLRGLLFNAAAGSYTVAGFDVALAREKVMVLDPGSYAVSGQPTTNLRDLLLSAVPGSYIVTGQAGALLRGLWLDASPGTYAVSGDDAALARGKLLLADPGSYSVTGEAATTLRELLFAAESGTYTVAGVAATLEKVGSYELDASPGAYVVTGQPAASIKTSLLVASPGAYTVAGFAAPTLAGRVIVAGTGSYVVTGVDAALETVGVYILAADPGLYVVTGFDADFTYTAIVPAAPTIVLSWGGGRRRRLRQEDQLRLKDLDRELQLEAERRQRELEIRLEREAAAERRQAEADIEADRRAKLALLAEKEAAARRQIQEQTAGEAEAADAIGRRGRILDELTFQFEQYRTRVEQEARAETARRRKALAETAVRRAAEAHRRFVAAFQLAAQKAEEDFIASLEMNRRMAVAREVGIQEGQAWAEERMARQSQADALDHVRTLFEL